MVVPANHSRQKAYVVEFLIATYMCPLPDSKSVRPDDRMTL